MRATVRILAICALLGPFVLATQAAATTRASQHVTQADDLRYVIAGDAAASSEPIGKTLGVMKLRHAIGGSLAPNRYQVLRDSL